MGGARCGSRLGRIDLVERLGDHPNDRRDLRHAADPQGPKPAAHEQCEAGQAMEDPRQPAAALLGMDHHQAEVEDGDVRKSECCTGSGPSASGPDAARQVCISCRSGMRSNSDSSAWSHPIPKAAARSTEV